MAAGADEACVIEAGGSDPMIITAHAPLDVAAAGAVTAAFHMSGQVCTSAERFFVVDAVHDAFIAGLRRRNVGACASEMAWQAEIGPLVSEAARAKVMRLVEDAVAKGAKVEIGGGIPRRNQSAGSMSRRS
jgi:acyl-CoA reductase-like NAD-dependent aldehyde dehydrogenase